jgi:hypothetical protein
MKKLLFAIVLIFTVGISFANNILVQNVTTTGNNATNKTIQVQFDLSWDNSWRDAINWDAAWVFLKFKNASGVWQHAQLNTTGFANGTGTANTMQVTSDKVGCWVYRSAQGSGTFNNTSMQLQWNYGLSGLTSVTGLEVRVFAVEMVYVPEGDFNCAGTPYYGASFSYGTGGSRQNGLFYAPGQNFPVINTKLTPTLTYNDGTATTLRIKGDAGLDTDNNGTIDNTSYPTGYRHFYCYKYEMTEQQYADFLNTLTATQITTLGVAGTGITLSNGQYFSSTPNKACGNATAARLFAYADWSGVRPMSFLEFNKASYGPLQPVGMDFCSDIIRGYPSWGLWECPNVNLNYQLADVGYMANSSSNRAYAGASYYGVLDLTGSAIESVVKLNYTSFSTGNGNGVLASSGITDITNWNTTGMMIFIDQHQNWPYSGASRFGFRYVRSAE